MKHNDDLTDALRYLGLDAQLRKAEGDEIMKKAHKAIVDIFRCHFKAGYTCVSIHDSNGSKMVGWAHPDDFYRGSFSMSVEPINVLGRFEVVEITRG